MCGEEGESRGGDRLPGLDRPDARARRGRRESSVHDPAVPRWAGEPDRNHGPFPAHVPGRDRLDTSERGDRLARRDRVSRFGRLSRLSRWDRSARGARSGRSNRWGPSSRLDRWDRRARYAADRRVFREARRGRRELHRGEREAFHGAFRAAFPVQVACGARHRAGRRWAMPASSVGPPLAWR